MGAKQSKRSVDISGKEAEGASEVAAAGAGGEGRVEPLADADALKPQLNGDAHILEKTDKEKDLDSGTPEIEKDATTEKETKQEEDGDVAPVTNGETEQKVENGETTPTSEDGKKPKKEKVKKKWSLRSISFSRKDKPKQEKKKEDEAKTNGEPEKVPEETNEVAPEAAEEATTEESKSQSESKPEEKTPETPVTEPITNGTATPESPKIETPPTEELVPEVASLAATSPEVPSPAIASPEVVSPAVESPTVASPEVVSPEPEAKPKSESKPDVEPEQLPVNGLSLEDSKESPEVEKTEESKPEEPAAEKTEIVPETPVIKEVCVDQMPLIDPTPPPLPANPPPSSVASFAATTMAPELTDASLANTADTAIPTLPADSITKDVVSKIPSEPTNELTGTQTVITASSIPSKPIDEKNLDSFVLNEVVLENGKAIDESVTQDTVATQESEIQINKEIPIILNEIEKEPMTEIPEDVPKSLETTLEVIENKPNDSENIEIYVHVETFQSPVDMTPEGPKSPISSLSEGITETQISEDVPINEPSQIETTEKTDVLENELESSEEIKKETIEASDVTESTAEIITVVPEAPEIKPEVEDAKSVATPAPDRVEEPMDIEIITNSGDLPAETDVSQNDSSEELPPPPPPICDDIEDNTANMDEDIDSISEKAIETTEVLINSNHAVEVDEIVPLDNEVSKDNAKQGVGKIAKDALGNVIECNGNTEEEKSPTEESAPEVTPAAPSPVPQDPLPTCDKLSELIPEVPAIPEFKTETESPTDVAVAN